MTDANDSVYPKCERIRCSGTSSQDAGHDLSRNVGQAKLPALVGKRQFFVVDPKETQDRGMQVMDVDNVCLLYTSDAADE